MSAVSSARSASRVGPWPHTSSRMRQYSSPARRDGLALGFGQHAALSFHGPAQPVLVAGAARNALSPPERGSVELAQEQAVPGIAAVAVHGHTESGGTPAQVAVLPAELECRQLAELPDPEAEGLARRGLPGWPRPPGGASTSTSMSAERLMLSPPPMSLPSLAPRRRCRLQNSSGSSRSRCSRAAYSPDVPGLQPRQTSNPDSASHARSSIPLWSAQARAATSRV